MIIVIADEMTGAAEAAAISHSFGLSTSLLVNVSDDLPVSDVLVVATDTRTMYEHEAVEETHRICQILKQAMPKLNQARQAAMSPLQRAQALANADDVLHIFKYTDSILRGHIHLELRALVEESRYEQVMYLPANPTKGQTIRGGRYFINGVPLDQTQYKQDPEFPASTANVAAAIGVAPGSRLRICDAEDKSDVQRCVKLAMNNRMATLLAGSSELYVTFLEHLGKKPSRAKSFSGLSEKGAMLILSGSTDGVDLTDKPYVRRHNMANVPMPQETFKAVCEHKTSISEAADKWMGRLKQAQIVSGKTASFVLSLPYPTTGIPQAAKTLCEVTAEMAQRLASANAPSELIIEEGRTAYVALKQMGWTRFLVSQHLPDGIVRLQCLDHSSSHITLKPGSSSWGTLLD